MFQELLRAELQKRQLKNPQYSLRSFARDLQVSPSMISRFLSGERLPSVETMGQILEHLQIDPALKKRVLETKITSREFNVPKDEDYVELTQAQIEKISDWLYSALLERLRSTRRPAKTIKELARDLGQTFAEIDRRVKTLIEIGLVKKTEAGYKTVNSKQTAKLSRKILDQIHSGYLERAAEAMEYSTETERSNSGTTILIDPKRLTEAVERIKYFRRSLAEFLEVKPTDKVDQLYRIQIALFPLEKK